ncbi:MAG TPA: hypothetical protein VIK91_00180 [Nannocystis sp.]
MAVLDLAPVPVGLDWQALWQQLAALAVVVLATAWLTVRWLTRRRGPCGGVCSRCTACENSRGASDAKISGAISRTEPARGLRPAGLRVVQGPGAPAEPPHAGPLPGA